MGKDRKGFFPTCTPPKNRIFFPALTKVPTTRGKGRGRHVKWSARKKWATISPRIGRHPLLLLLLFLPCQRELVIERISSFPCSSPLPILFYYHDPLFPCPLLLVSHFTKNVAPRPSEGVGGWMRRGERKGMILPYCDHILTFFRRGEGGAELFSTLFAVFLFPPQSV